MLNVVKYPINVFKYPPTKVEDYFSLVLPRGSKILTVEVWQGAPQLWALVNPEEPEEKRNFRLVGAGNPIFANAGNPITESPETLNYICTFQLAGLVGIIGHLFEIM
jgi:hypothetical protein